MARKPPTGSRAGGRSAKRAKARRWSVPPAHNSRNNIERYGSRFWGLYSEGELLAVTVYKKGAMRLQQILQNHPCAKEDASATAVREEAE